MRELRVGTTQIPENNANVFQLVFSQIDNDGNQPFYTPTSQSLVNGTTFLYLDMIEFEEVTVGNITQLRMKFDDSLTVRNVAGEDCQSHEG